ncbi:MAG: YebC/PmpR family DNA-binding transcriptional regulator [Elusimicrobiaceae bacterium]|jgi:YebC/PmpR family DNA-binding regulatory protein|nr:YebC/PmpR family DNA-binding transcriptional regulator [Elusimicrobiaceae bacterium]
MGGHSHWAGIKHKKALVDAKKGKVFTKLIREITIAAKIGGADLGSNARLRKAVDDAKAANMPAENVKRAIMKGTGQLPGTVYEEITYEGYGPNSVAVIVECTTDNKNRTFAEIRKIFQNHGGAIGTSGCVSYMFSKKGVILVSKEDASEETLMDVALEAGAEDIKTSAEGFEVVTAPDTFEAVKAALEGKNIKLASAEITMVPSNEVEITDAEAASKIVRLIETLDEHDDTKEVYSNDKISDEVLAKIEEK